jgi:hypothetical protein
LILLGAGSSVPFGIPAMKKFAELFKEKITDKPALSQLFNNIEAALSNSNLTVGYNITFDLESLMVVLQDIASDINRPISLPTFAFMLGSDSKSKERQSVNDIKSLRVAFGQDASKLLADLQYFIFDTCFEPIRKGQKEKTFRLLDFLYRPLFALIGLQILSKQESWIFTTNWDLCLKQWLAYSLIPFEDGTIHDAQRRTVLNPHLGWTDQTTAHIRVVPLHGSFDLINCTRIISDKSFMEIEKVNNPEAYFKGNPSELANAFIVYPIEAVGYAQTIRSPYLDMLTKLKAKLRDESTVFVIGFSFRDSIIASIFDEVIREKLESKYANSMNVLLIDADPEAVVENLNRQGYTNIANAIAQVQLTFPDVQKYEKKREIMEDMQIVLNKIAGKMNDQKIEFNRQNVNSALGKYSLVI